MKVILTNPPEVNLNQVDEEEVERYLRQQDVYRMYNYLR